MSGSDQTGGTLDAVFITVLLECCPRVRGPASREAPNASWGIDLTIPGLAPGASNELERVSGNTMCHAKHNRQDVGAFRATVPA